MFVTCSCSWSLTVCKSKFMLIPLKTITFVFHGWVCMQKCCLFIINKKPKGILQVWKIYIVFLVCVWISVATFRFSELFIFLVNSQSLKSPFLFLSWALLAQYSLNRTVVRTYECHLLSERWRIIIQCFFPFCSSPLNNCISNRQKCTLMGSFSRWAQYFFQFFILFYWHHKLS